MQVRTRHYITLAHLLLLTASRSLQAGDPIILDPGKGSVVIYGGSLSADHFYDIQGDLRRFDTNNTRFSAVLFGTTCRYGLTNRIELSAELPLAYLSLTSRSRFPDRSIFAPSYLGLGGAVQLTRGEIFNASADIMLKIPPGFHNGIYDDPNHPSFLSDGFFQATAGTNVSLWTDPILLKGRMAYNWRDEEPVDEFQYSLSAILTRVEGTGIHVGFDGVVPLADVTQPLLPFYAGASGTAEQIGRIDGGTGRFATIDREFYIALNAGAYVNITGSIVISGNYSIRLAGTNSLALGGAFLALGYSF